MNLSEKLVNIQSELKAPKGQYNSFGKYHYRSCEDIMEGVKPLLLKYKCALVIKDDLEKIGDRYYIRATATLIDAESEERIETFAYAREAEQKKGMDESQVTGATSSYARKYCLNGLFSIDDTKDADTDSYAQQQQNKAPQKAEQKSGKITAEQAAKIKTIYNKVGDDVKEKIVQLLKDEGCNSIIDIDSAKYQKIAIEISKLVKGE